MDKNAIKKYAIWARTELLKRVAAKAQEFGINADETAPENMVVINGTAMSDTQRSQRRALITQIQEKGYLQVMEEVAYTWFNRFCALRFMEVNGYLPSRVRVFSDDENNFKPQILTEAINLSLDGLEMSKVYKFKEANDDEGLFKYLIITQCNALNAVLPVMFQRIADYTELLFPDNLLREGSVVSELVVSISEDNWLDSVQIIGWLYQYYNLELLSEINEKDFVIKTDIPAKTQFFTTDWIVRYMVENSLGRLWIEGHPDDNLRSNWKYYLDEAQQEDSVKAQLDEIRKEYATLTPQQIKCIDPCAGSGHICVYMFDVLMQIYESYGYSAVEAVRSIIENNLYGLDIDERASQLAYFSVMMKARQYDRRFLSRKDEYGNSDVPQPHVYEIIESNGVDTSVVELLAGDDVAVKDALNTILSEMYDAKEYGSILNITNVDFEAIYNCFDQMISEGSFFTEVIKNKLLPLVKVAQTMAQKYDVVVTNPPYLGVKKYNPTLSEFVKTYYKNYKYDLFSCFIIKGRNMIKNNGYVGMLTQQSWLNVDSFEKLRKYIIDNNRVLHIAHLGLNALEGGLGTVAFIFSHKSSTNYITKFIDLSSYDYENKNNNLHNHNNTTEKDINIFYNLPKTIFAYDMSSELINSFLLDKKISNLSIPKSGLVTRNNKLFLKLWFEVKDENIEYSCDLINFNKKWYPHTKGGSYRKWYGNFEYVVNWKNNGYDIREATKNANGGSIVSQECYFLEGLSWSLSTFSNKFSMRILPKGFIFNVEAPAIFNVPHKEYVLGLLNSKVGEVFLEILSDDVHYKTNDIGSVPLILHTDNFVIKELVKENISLSKTDWDSFETSWDFEVHPFVRLSRGLWDATAVGASMMHYYGEHKRVSCPLELCFMLWQGECQERFNKLKGNEEELNRIFIDIYGLQDELTPEVEDKDVTVRLADRKRDVKSFISYSVGCMFGRYSLDTLGLAFAGGEFDSSKYKSFKADVDNIIPICDDEYFEDDIVGLFEQFVATVYGEESLEDNLQYIADSLGGSGSKRDIIRNYFRNEFYADHLKMYQKRPIYWQFDSGKKGGFKALVYMHRYEGDTIARMRTDYVHEQQSRYLTAIDDVKQRMDSATTAERARLNKQLIKLQDQAQELHAYEEKIHHLADQYITIDLDDGVKNNYEIFKAVLAKLK